MRFATYLLALGLAGPVLAAEASPTGAGSPPGYHAHRRYYTVGTHHPYYRPHLRLHFAGNLATYNGDLTSRFRDNTLRLGYGVGLTQVLSPRLTFTADVARVLLQASDQTLERGYTFSGGNGVLSALLRYNLWADKSLFAALSQKATPVTVFVQAGVATVLYNPAAARFGQPLLPEAGESYPSLAAALPVGAGLTWHATNHLFLTLDARYYFTTTDLLDDISQRGNPSVNDSFATVSLQVEYALGRHHGKRLVHTD